MDELETRLLEEYAARGRFGHREHLHMAWSFLRRDRATASDAAARFIHHVAAEHGDLEKYHETLTRFWVAVVKLAIDETGDPADFEQLLARAPHLLERDLPSRHWSSESLWSPAARAAWMEPDLRPLPVS